MLHRLEINFTWHVSLWQISASCNSVPMPLKGMQIVHEFALTPVNLIEIMFDGKDATVDPDLYVGIDSMYLDYVDVTPILRQAVYCTDHPDYPRIIPCTDINLNGIWRLQCSESVMAQQITNYLGIRDAV